MDRQSYEFASDRNGGLYVTRAPKSWRLIHIDRQLDEVLREMARREHGFLFNPYSCASWEKAWKKHPDLRAREDALMRLRGEAQDYQWRMDAKARDAEQRRRRIEFQRESRHAFEASKCPTCGAHTLHSQHQLAA